MVKVARLNVFDYQPHPRLEELHRHGPPTTRHARGVHSENWITRTNAHIGLKITLWTGTMWCAYVFAAICFISLPAAIHQGFFYLITIWLVSAFLELVLLPIIIVGQNIQGKAADARAQHTYENACAILHEAQQIQAHLLAQDDVLSQIIADQKARNGTR